MLKLLGLDKEGKRQQCIIKISEMLRKNYNNLTYTFILLTEWSVITNTSTNPKSVLLFDSNRVGLVKFKKILICYSFIDSIY